jgi:hypothetical protein
LGAKATTTTTTATATGDGYVDGDDDGRAISI